MTASGTAAITDPMTMSRWRAALAHAEQQEREQQHGA